MNLPPYTHFPVLENERIILLDIKEADVDQLTEISFYEKTELYENKSISYTALGLPTTE